MEAERAGACYVMCSIQMIFIAFWQDQQKDGHVQANLAGLIALLGHQSSIEDLFVL